MLLAAALFSDSDNSNSGSSDGSRGHCTACGVNQQQLPPSASLWMLQGKQAGILLLQQGQQQRFGGVCLVVDAARHTSRHPHGAAEAVGAARAVEVSVGAAGHLVLVLSNTRLSAGWGVCCC